MLSLLLQYRTRPGWFSRDWLKTWAKRILNLPKVGSYWVHSAIWRFRGAKIGPGTVFSKLRVQGRADNVRMGNFCSIGQVFIQAHAEVKIGNCVVINDDVRLITGSHDVNSELYDHVFAPIVVGDYAWIATGATILQGVNIGKGAVVAAAAVVTKDVAPFEIVGGNPARKISMREEKDFRYVPASWFAAIMAWTGRNPDLRNLADSSNLDQR